MEKVWIVIEETTYKNSDKKYIEILDVYSTKEKANEFLEEKNEPLAERKWGLGGLWLNFSDKETLYRIIEKSVK